MSGLLGLGNIENAFHEWVANTALSKKIRADQAEEARLAAKAEADRWGATFNGLQLHSAFGESMLQL